MSTQHDSLRQRYEQHAIKNEYSKIDDQNIKRAASEVVDILSETYPEHTFEKKAYLTLPQIEEFCGRKFNIGFDFSRRKLAPDGGVIWMDNKYPILITEAKRQGTNNERMAEGKEKQAIGNAIERLGKNLIGFKCLYEQEDILPFACFCWGCDFADGTVLAKVYTLNSFYELNTIYTDVKDIINKPFTLLTKPEQAFSLEEMIIPMLKIAEYSIKYFLSKEERVK